MQAAYRLRGFTGLHVLPGLIDPPVHLNEPGRTGWESFATGGAATVFDMTVHAATDADGWIRRAKDADFADSLGLFGERGVSGKGRIEAEDLFQRHEQSLCVGRLLGVRIPVVPVRGDAVFDGGKATPEPAGRLVRPAD